MSISVRDGLEELLAPSTKRLCRERGLWTGGNQVDRLSRLARSFRGDPAALLGALRRDELLRILRAPWETDDDREFFFTALGRSNKSSLLELAARLFVEGWCPSENGERPVPDAMIEVRFEDAWDDSEGEEDDLHQDGEHEQGELDNKVSNIPSHDNEVFVLAFAALSMPVSIEQINDARREGAMYFHPDRNPASRNATEKMTRFNDGCDRLKARLLLDHRHR